MVARKNADGTKYFYHADHLGSTSLITDQNGNVVENEFYSPFGESLSTNNAEENKLYTGQFKDTTGMYYYGARYYLVNPPIFISGDPIFYDLINATAIIITLGYTSNYLKLSCKENCKRWL